jgi:hypothetical protein
LKMASCRRSQACCSATIFISSVSIVSSLVICSPHHNVPTSKEFHIARSCYSSLRKGGVCRFCGGREVASISSLLRVR